MSRIIHRLRNLINVHAAFLILLAFGGNRATAQWAFLGNPLISDNAVSSQALALSPQWNPYLAYTSGGAVFVEWFDGSEWENHGTQGLPTNGVNDCALAFLPDGTACLAGAPNLASYQFDNGSWQWMPGLVSIQNIQGLQMRVASDGRLWLAGFRAGPTDSTLIFSKAVNGNWLALGMLEGRVIDMELDDLGEPLILMSTANAILHRVNGLWQNLPYFSQPDEEYISFQMLYDGSGTGMVTLRRDSADGITAEQLSLGAWTQMGTAGFTNGDIATLGLSHAGTAYVLSVDHAAGGPPRAYEFVAGNWQFLGGQSVYNNTVSQPQWAFDPTAAYLVFRDDEENSRNSVMFLGSPNAVEGLREPQTVHLWPNPTAEYLWIECKTNLKNAEIQVCDLMGRIVLHERTRGNSPIKLSVGHLPEGQYSILVTNLQQPPLYGTFTKLN
jgi:hypothetical protein